MFHFGQKIKKIQVVNFFKILQNYFGKKKGNCLKKLRKDPYHLI